MLKTSIICVISLLSTRAFAQPTPWTERIEFSGDVRYRHEYQNKTKASDTADAHRERLRLRFGATAKVNEQVKARFRLSTSDGQSPVGPNFTFKDNASKKGIYVDLGTIEWTASESMTVTVGKMENPFRVLPQSQLIFDVDYTPEGAAFALNSGGVFVRAAAFMLEERTQQANGTSEPDSWLHSGMAGYKKENPDGLAFMGAVAFHNFTSLKNNQALFVSTSSTNSFLGNSANGTGASARYANEYQVAEVLGEVRMNSAAQSLALYADALQNVAIDKLNRAIYIGAGWQSLNENRKPIWTVNYAYETTEKDATVSALNYSDIANGLDGHFGHIFAVARTLGSNVTAQFVFTHAYVDDSGKPYWADRGLFDIVASF